MPMLPRFLSPDADDFRCRFAAATMMPFRFDAALPRVSPLPLIYAADDD